VVVSAAMKLSLYLRNRKHNTCSKEVIALKHMKSNVRFRQRCVRHDLGLKSAVSQVLHQGPPPTCSDDDFLQRAHPRYHHELSSNTLVIWTMQWNPEAWGYKKKR